MARKVLMSEQIRTIFGTSVDINQYNLSSHIPLPQTGATHQKFMWWEIPQEYIDNPNHKDLQNLGIRADQNLDRAEDDFAHSVRKDGWKIGPFPPTVGTDNRPRNGRKRIRIAIKAGERFIPVALNSYKGFKNEVEDKRSRITTGLQLNMDDDYSEPAQFKDFKKAASVLISEGTDLSTEKLVDEWLFNELLIDDYLSPQSVTKLRGSILNMGKDGSDHMIKMSRDEAMKYLADCPEIRDNYGIKTPHKQSNEPKIPELCLYTPNDINAFRVLCQHIFQNVTTKRETLIALYTNDYDPETATKAMKKFEVTLKDLVSRSGQFVENELTGISFNKPFVSSGYKILGCIPQKTTTKSKLHEKLFDSKSLIKIEDY